MPSRPTVLAVLAVFLAAAGTATAAKLIDGSTIRKGTVTTRQIADRTLKTGDLSRSAIAALRGRVTSIDGGDIVDGTVGSTDLAPSSVGTVQVNDRSLTAGDIATDALTATEVGTGAVGVDELGNDSVGNSEIRGAAISRNQIRTNVLRAGTVTVDFGDIAAGCETQTAPGATYNIPAGALAGTAILVGAPAALPDGLVVEGRPSAEGNDLRVQVCNLTGAPIAVGSQTFPFTAFGT